MKKCWGNISLINNELVFFGSQERQIIIPLNEINDLQQRKALIHFTLNNGEVWTFFCSPRRSALGFAEAMELRKKSQNMAALLNYIRKGK